MTGTRRHVLITGASRGIGRLAVERFARGGWSVIAGVRDPAHLEPFDVGGVEVVRLDLNEPEQIAAAADRAHAIAGGALDCVVNNAGWDLFVPFLDTAPDDWSRLIDVNLVGALHMHHAVLPSMVARSAGRVVNVSSDAARVGSSGEAVYAACKAGLVAFSKTLAREHARHGITFNVVCPGPTDTALLATVTDAAANPEKLREAFRRAIPVGRLGEPEDLVGMAIYLLSPASDFCTGQIMYVDGGYTAG